MNDGLGLAISFFYIAAILLIAIKLQNLPFEFSRKFVHIMAANWWFIATATMTSPWIASITPLFFVIFNAVTITFGWLPAINRQEQPKNFGTVYYALSVLFLTFISFQSGSSFALGGVGILVMGYGDGLASLVGRKFGKHSFQLFQAKKSLEGSATMFFVTLITLTVYLTYVNGMVMIPLVLMLSLVATLVEAICPWGLDNILVPIVTSLVYFVYML